MKLPTSTRRLSGLPIAASQLFLIVITSLIEATATTSNQALRNRTNYLNLGKSTSSSNNNYVKSVNSSRIAPSFEQLKATRKGRFANIAANNDHDSEDDGDDHHAQIVSPDQPMADEIEQQQQQHMRPVEVPKEGLMQMKRAARNVEQRMSLVDGRVDQIQSQIAEDHNPYRQQPQPQQQQQDLQRQVAYSTPYNEQDLSSASEENGAQQQSEKLTDWSRSTPIIGHSNKTSYSEIRSYVPASATSLSNANFSAPVAHGDDQPPVDRSSPTVGDNQPAAAADDSQPTGQNETYYTGPTNNFSQLDNQPAESAARVASEPGGAGWNNDRYQFFAAMNERNHNQAPTHTDQTLDSSERFGNMTVVNSPTDLINSYTTPQQQTGVAPDETPSQKSPTKSQQQQQQQQSSRTAPITVYKGNYGKSRSAQSMPHAQVYSGQQNDTNRSDHARWNSIATAPSYSRNSESNIYSPQPVAATTVSQETYSPATAGDHHHQQQQQQLVDRPILAPNRPASFHEEQPPNSRRFTTNAQSQHHYSVPYPVADTKRSTYTNTSDHLRHRSSHSTNEDSSSVSVASGSSNAADSMAATPTLGSGHQSNDQSMDVASPAADSYRQTQHTLSRLIPMLEQQAASRDHGAQQYVFNKNSNNNNNNNNDLYNLAAAAQDRQEWPSSSMAAAAVDQSSNNNNNEYANNERVDQQQQYYYLPRANQPALSDSDIGGSQMMADSMQPAATNSQNYAQQQQYAAYYPSTAEVNSLIRRYRQQQQQQQQLFASNQDNLVPATYRDSADMTNSAQSFRRYSLPAQMDTSYQPQQQQQRPTTSSQDSDYYQPAQTYFYSPQSLTTNSIRSTNDLAAYYRALMAATRAPEYTALQQQQARSTNQYNLANKQPTGGSLYAAAAMNTPIFYEAPVGQARSSGGGGGGQEQQVGGGQAPLDQQSTEQQQLKRSYSLFKPTASSRYFYAPSYGTLSPFALASSPATAYQSAYANTDPAALQSAWQQLYAAAAQKQYAYAALPPGAYTAATAASAPQSTIDQGQQYQTQYIADPEMAESSLVPATSGGALDPSSLFSVAGSSAYATPHFGASTMSAGQQQQQDASGSGSGDSSGAASESKGKSMTPWTNIAGLLLGILPFGILMASLLPAVTVTGRKKRELEIGGRNFSDLLKWRAPSKVLETLMLGPQQQDAGSSLASIIGEQWAQLMGSRSTNDRIEDEERSSRRRSLVSGGPFSGIQRTKKSSSIVQQNSTSIAESTSAALNSTSNSLAKDQQQQQQEAGLVKSKVKKALSALNNFITAAQTNIKRKHRSSLIDSQWISPLSSLKSSLRLEQLFNMTDFKRQLASAIQAKAIATQNQILQQQQQQVKQLQKYLNKTNLTSLGALRLSPQSQPLRQPVAVVQEMPAKTPSLTNNSIQSSERSDIPKSATAITTEAATTAIPSTASTTATEPASIAITVMEPPSRSRVEASLVVADRPVEPIKAALNESASAVTANNSTRHRLEVCLNQFLCRLTVKLNKSLKSAPIATATANSNETLSADQLERITKRYINQLVEQIEAEHPNVSLSVNRSVDGSQKSPMQHQVSDSALDVLYKNAMRNQCSLMYNCLELIQLEKMLSKMKLKFS